MKFFYVTNKKVRIVITHPDFAFIVSALRSPAFTLAFRDNVARSTTEMIERYMDINFTSSELANQRRIQGNLDLKVYLLAV